MAKNVCGFICTRYRQPDYYKELFGHYNAVYLTEKGSEVMIEAQTSYLCSKSIGSCITSYDILLQTPKYRKVLVHDIKTQKRAIELIEKFIKKY